MKGCTLRVLSLVSQLGSHLDLDQILYKIGFVGIVVVVVAVAGMKPPNQPRGRRNVASFPWSRQKIRCAIKYCIIH